MKPPRKPRPKTIASRKRASGNSKRTNDQREADLVIVSHLASQGFQQTYIHAHINTLREGQYKLSPRTITYDLAAIREEWSKTRVHNLNEFVNRELLLIDFLQTEAIEGWHKSKAEKKKTEAEQASFSKGGKRAGTRSKLTREERDGTADFLAVALRCHERRCRLLGLDKPVKNEHGGFDGAPLPLVGAPHLLEIKILSENEASAVQATNNEA